MKEEELKKLYVEHFGATEAQAQERMLELDECMEYCDTKFKALAERPCPIGDSVFADFAKSFAEPEAARIKALLGDPDEAFPQMRKNPYLFEDVFKKPPEPIDEKEWAMLTYVKTKSSHSHELHRLTFRQVACYIACRCRDAVKSNWGVILLAAILFCVYAFREDDRPDLHTLNELKAAADDALRERADSVLHNKSEVSTAETDVESENEAGFMRPEKNSMNEMC